ncbi:YggT family protein [uncultured Mailhella sp.]|uniref:YggT family protein n=1 Tax=uncultured Mailhella sp. TaxID=1981031 RepID=UPI0025F528F8|nr:YggT family protein [uncultured Mailhella sp.]
MFVFANLVTTVAGLLSLVINLYIFVVIVAAFLSWVKPDPYNAIVRTLRGLTEPVFYRVRKAFPFVMVNGIDLSPIVVLVALQLLNGVVVQSLLQLGLRLTGV